ncbi:MAG TPA: hypothetical protein VFT59_03720 [Candidatus Saccharimonadales bacterium]|nr:hypothetical protein [Candidatus Saccharimonadales bacterium]
MKIATKTIASLLIVTAVAAAVPGISVKIPPGRKRTKYESRFDRLLQRHDRKCELRAAVLGLDVRTFRDLQKQYTFERIIKQRGFKSTREFRIALMGMLKHELHNRGWSGTRIKNYMATRSARLN